MCHDMLMNVQYLQSYYFQLLTLRNYLNMMNKNSYVHMLDTSCIMENDEITDNITDKQIFSHAGLRRYEERRLQMKRVPHMLTGRL